MLNVLGAYQYLKITILLASASGLELFLVPPQVNATRITCNTEFTDIPEKWSIK